MDKKKYASMHSMGDLNQHISLEYFEKELEGELEEILGFWWHHTRDLERGGFYGKMDNANQVYKEAPKGSVMHSRILWAFSAGYLFNGHSDWLMAAYRAYEFLTDFFLDPIFGGVYWTVDFKGDLLDTKKQIYALAFAVYGLSEFYRATGESQALSHARGIYQCIVEKSYDRIFGGYIEAFGRKWEDIGEIRLSAKDANEKKSMNTHLHVLEGFASLYRVWPDEGLRSQIQELLDIFQNHIVDPHTGHLILFFDQQWSPRSETISFGHDIEASWLLLEAAEIIEDPLRTERMKALSQTLGLAATRGLDQDGGLWYELEPGNNQWTREKHSWPQAESMVGFFSMWELTADNKYLEKALKTWQFVKEHIKDLRNGEWFWGVNEDGSVMLMDKVGIWKCPYHNSRACLELIGRIRRNVAKTI